MQVMMRAIVVFAVAAIAATAASAQEYKLPENDYPTEARADYVFACMQVNGQTRDSLRRCSCSIDEIAALIPWSKYEEAETLMSVVQKGGENVNWAMNPMMQNKINDLKRAQVEGELRCF